MSSSLERDHMDELCTDAFNSGRMERQGCTTYLRSHFALEMHCDKIVPATHGLF